LSLINQTPNAPALVSWGVFICPVGAGEIEVQLETRPAAMDAVATKGLT